MKTIILKVFFVLVIQSTAFISFCQPTSLGFGVKDWGFQTGVSINALFKTAIAVDSSGNKWIGYTKLGIHKFDDLNWTLYNVANGNLPSDSVTSIVAKGNIVYVGTKNGIAKYENGSWSTINTSNSQLVSNVINTMFCKNNVLWVGTNLGVSKLNGTTWTTYNTTNSQLCFNNVQAIEQTATGDIYIGTSNGLSKLSAGIWTTFNTSNSGLGDNNIISLCSDNMNKLFIGTNSKGAFIYNNNTIQSLLVAYPKLSSYVYDQSHTHILYSKIFDIAKDANGSVYINTVSINSNNDIKYLLIKIKSIEFSICRMPNNIRPMFFECETADNLWFVNSEISLTTLPRTKNLYSFIFSESVFRDDFELLNINNVKAGISSSGYLFKDYINFEKSMFTIPKDSNMSTIFCGNLWIGAKDNNGSLYIATERYREVEQHNENRDYQPGPISYDSSIYNIEREKWNHTWKVSKSEIDYHRTHYNNLGYAIPNEIAIWPGNGNPVLGQSQFLAPYADANGNGKYDPQNGDYPIIRGDQALYFIYNDQRNHTESSGTALSVECHGLAYAFSNPADTALNNTIFINYRIFNHSQNNYDSLYIGTFTDFDLGYAWDDFVGCDSVISSYYAYNGKNIDGTGQNYAYGTYPPAQGVSFLNQQLTSFMCYNNAAGPYGEPDVPLHYYNYMSGKWKDNTHLLFGGDGHGSGIGSTNFTTNYIFSGNPEDTADWTEISANNVPGDRRGLGSIGPYTLLKDSSICVDIAYTFARDYTDTINTASVTKLKQYVQNIRNYYNTNLVHNCSDLFSSVNELRKTKSELIVFPNPAKDVLNVYLIQFKNLQNNSISIYNIQGQLLLQQGIKQQQTEINISSYAKGIYIVKVINDDNPVVSKFIKE
jgi:hypothetical protein